MNYFFQVLCKQQPLGLKKVEAEQTYQKKLAGSESYLIPLDAPQN